MDKYEAYEELDELEKMCLAQIPLDMMPMEQDKPKKNISHNIQRARIGVNLIYDHGYEIGPGFSVLDKYKEHQGYFWIVDGIQRHIYSCEEAVI